MCTFVFHNIALMLSSHTKEKLYLHNIFFTIRLPLNIIQNHRKSHTKTESSRTSVRGVRNHQPAKKNKINQSDKPVFGLSPSIKLGLIGVKWPRIRATQDAVANGLATSCLPRESMLAKGQQITAYLTILSLIYKHTASVWSGHQYISYPLE